MAQNRSSAVMQQRHEPRDSLDDFVTPPWATRALCERLTLMGEDLPRMTVREPAANRGFMARPLGEYFGEVDASDVHDYGAGYPVRDYLFPTPLEPVDWTISNPPFRLAERFIERALDSSRRGVAMIVRSAFIEGVGRHERLFSPRPPSHVMQFAERVPMVRGRYDAAATTATAYLWLVWAKGFRGTRLQWIAPCRKRLERVGDAANPVSEGREGIAL